MKRKVEVRLRAPEYQKTSDARGACHLNVKVPITRLLSSFDFIRYIITNNVVHNHTFASYLLTGLRSSFNNSIPFLYLLRDLLILVL